MTQALDPKLWVRVPLVAKALFSLQSTQLYPKIWGGVFHRILRRGCKVISPRGYFRPSSATLNGGKPPKGHHYTFTKMYILLYNYILHKAHRVIRERCTMRVLDAELLYHSLSVAHKNIWNCTFQFFSSIEALSFKHINSHDQSILAL